MAAWMSQHEIELHDPDKNCEYYPPLPIHAVLRMYLNYGLTQHRMFLLSQDKDEVYVR